MNSKYNNKYIISDITLICHQLNRQTAYNVTFEHFEDTNSICITAFEENSDKPYLVEEYNLNTEDFSISTFHDRWCTALV